MDRLASELTRSEAESSSLQADVETKGAALEALEGVLSKIEQAVESKSLAGPGRQPSAPVLKPESA